LNIENHSRIRINGLLEGLERDSYHADQDGRCSSEPNTNCRNTESHRINGHRLVYVAAEGGITSAI
jgi:Txe/YoeB family toxin of Txe-Axe toxin-antitoxin module